MSRLQTLRELVGHFMHRQRFVLAPLLIVLLLASMLLMATSGLAYVAPLSYSIF